MSPRRRLGALCEGEGNSSAEGGVIPRRMPRKSFNERQLARVPVGVRLSLRASCGGCAEADTSSLWPSHGLGCDNCHKSTQKFSDGQAWRALFFVRKELKKVSQSGDALSVGVGRKKPCQPFGTSAGLLYLCGQLYYNKVYV